MLGLLGRLGVSSVLARKCSVNVVVVVSGNRDTNFSEPYFHPFWNISSPQTIPFLTTALSAFCLDCAGPLTVLGLPPCLDFSARLPRPEHWGAPLGCALNACPLPSPQSLRQASLPPRAALLPCAPQSQQTSSLLIYCERKWRIPCTLPPQCPSACQ